MGSVIINVTMEQVVAAFERDSGIRQHTLRAKWHSEVGIRHAFHDALRAIQATRGLDEIWLEEISVEKNGIIFIRVTARNGLNKKTLEQIRQFEHALIGDNTNTT